MWLPALNFSRIGDQDGAVSDPALGSFFTNLFYFRLIKLLEEIMGEAENKSLIFTETKRRADELTRRMRRDG